MKRSEILFLICVLTGGGLFAARSILTTLGPAKPAADSPPGATGKARDVDMGLLLQKIRQGRLSEREALFARDASCFTESRTIDGLEVLVVLRGRKRADAVFGAAGGASGDIDQMIEILKSQGAVGARVERGEEVRLFGNELQRVGIRNPFRTGALCAELELHAGAVFSKGGAVVVAPTLNEARRWIGQDPGRFPEGIEVMTIGGTAEAPELRMSPGFHRFLAWGPGF